MKPEGLVPRSDSPYNAEATTRALRPAITHRRSFFVRSHFPVPKVDLEGWRLVVKGEVRRAREFTYSDLERMPRVEVAATLECAGNGRSGFGRPAEGELVWGPGAVGTARWSGVALARLLRAVGVKEGASEVVAEGLDAGDLAASGGPLTFSRGLPLPKALASGTMVALEMNGRPLAPEHGYPARLVVPGWYGMASVKWLKGISVVSGEPYKAFFNGVKYVYLHRKSGKTVSEPVAEARVKAMITSPVEGETLLRGVATTVRGKAWSGSGRISSVEVDLGEGWTGARLGPPSPGGFSWVSWSLRWVPRVKGRMTIAARATDEEGNVQPLEPFDNRYQYGYNAVQRIAVQVR